MLLRAPNLFQANRGLCATYPITIVLLYTALMG